MNDGPVLNKDCVGLRVKTLRELENGYFRCPEGTVGRIYSAVGANFTVEFDTCSVCGVALYMGNVRRSDLEIITPREEWKDSRRKPRKA